MVILSSSIALWASAATAEGWSEYSYPDLGFAVSFPADPMMETVPYSSADGTTTNKVVYTVRQGSDIYSIEVADLSNATIDETTAVDQAINQLRDKGAIRLDIPARVQRNYGRQLSVVGKDGSHSSVAIFFADHKLYQIEGTVLADSDDPNSGDAIRFQQSLRFIGDNAGRGFGPGFGNRQFRGGRRFRRDGNPADQNAPTGAPGSPNNRI
jgi:hypothetical protein